MTQSPSVPADARIAVTLSTIAYEKSSASADVQRQAMRFFDRNPLGRLVTRVVADVEALSEILTSGLQALFHDAFLLVGILLWLVVVDWELTLVTFLILPPLVLLTHVFRTWSRRAFRLVRERVAIVNSHLQETIQIG